ncbi:MAG: hypothetical protein CMH70_07755 [Nitrosomonadaceae bacterium]|nr:hypothetical protein [Nitrosomonadaceae bacterium]|tara:strand:+ start:441 stop:2129 length:1689 start_codon:yes stop_codon:yes gene_type:complete
MSKEIKSDLTEEAKVADSPKANSKPKGLRNSIIFLLFSAVSIATWQWYENNGFKKLPQELENLLAKTDKTNEGQLGENNIPIKNKLVENEINRPDENQLIESDISANKSLKETNTHIENKLLEIEKRLVEVESIEKQLAEINPSEELQNISNKIESNIVQTNSRFKLLETELTESIDKQKILEDLYRDLTPNHNETTIEDVEQLLLIANYQLRLANNIESAIVAMQEANVRLRRINHPKISYLQEILVQDIDLLKSVPKIDIIGIGLSLDNLIATIDQLPLEIERVLLPENNGTLTIPDSSSTLDKPMIPEVSQPWDRFLETLQGFFNDTPLAGGIFEEFMREIWSDIKKFVNFKELIRIEHVGKQDIPPPSHSYFLRENLKLHLLAAHNALLARNAEDFKSYIKKSIEWINKHFNNQSELGMSMLETLQQLHNHKIAITAPDISASYDAVRQYRISTKREVVNTLINSKVDAQKLAEDEKNKNLLSETKAESGTKTEVKMKVKTEIIEEAETEDDATIETGATEEETEAKSEEVGGVLIMKEEMGKGVEIEEEVEVEGENK